MQVLLDDGDYRQVQAAARRNGVTLAEWVREALRKALRPAPTVSAERKLECVRAASRHSLPTADIDQMLDEIERGFDGVPCVRRLG
jgi:nucleotidyltransferase/DNA polymerase involved in DNA repair